MDIQIARKPRGKVRDGKKARILLADDHPDVIDKVIQLLEPSYEIVGAIGDGQSLIYAAKKLKPDVLVIDITMPVLDGIEAAKILTAEGCESGIVFLTVHADPDYLRACLATGGLGYVVKARMSSDLPRAIEHALAERIFISPTMTGR
jgi:DNA-binding NarL/FixJ family response regulator